MDTYLQGRYLLELWWLPQAKHFPVAELAPVSISTQPRAMFLLNFTGVTWGFKTCTNISLCLSLRRKLCFWLSLYSRFYDFQLPYILTALLLLLHQDPCETITEKKFLPKVELTGHFYTSKNSNSSGLRVKLLCMMNNAEDQRGSVSSGVKGMCSW